MESFKLLSIVPYRKLELYGFWEGRIIIRLRLKKNFLISNKNLF